MDVSSHTPKSPVSLYYCHGAMGNQLWRYKVVSGRLRLQYLLNELQKKKICFVSRTPNNLCPVISNGKFYVWITVQKPRKFS